MITKTFQADSMMEALKMIQEDLGTEAIVLSVRETVQPGPSWAKKGRAGVEVVAMASEKPSPAAEEPKSPAQKVLRPTQNGGGVEFVEEKPEIEWDEPQGSQSANQPGNSQGNAHTNPARRDGQHPQQRGWHPKHLTHDEAATINRQVKVKPQSNGADPRVFRPVDEDGQTTAPVQPQKSVPETSSSVASAVLAAIAAAKSAAQPVSAEAAAQAEAAVQSALAGVKPSAAPAKPALAPTLSILRQKLLAQGVNPEHVDALMEMCASVLPAAALKDEKQCRAYLSKQLTADLIAAPAPSPASAPPARIMVLAGSSGSGKTSTVAKLAYFYAHVHNLKVAWISTDTIRTGAIVETRAFSDTIGIPLHLVYTPDDLPKALQACADRDLILVDSPGVNPYSEERMVELGGMLTTIPNRALYLVAAATTKEVDLTQAVASLGLYTLKGLIFTKLDETQSYGSLYNLARASRLPITFFSSGKGASAHLHWADPERLTAALFGKGWAA